MPEDSSVATNRHCSRKSQGKEYSKIFRRAGLAWGKGDIETAMAILQEGISRATERGDADIVYVFQQDLTRYQQALTGGEIDLSR
jgi:hypothetical protein